MTEPPENDDIYDVTDEPFAVKMDDSYHPPVCDEGFFGIKADSADVRLVKNKLREARENDIERRENAARQLAGEPKTKRKELRSFSMSTATVDEFKMKEKARSRNTLSASTSYVERLRALKKSRADDFRFCNDKLDTIEATASTEYPKNENATRAVNRQIIARLEQTGNAHAPNHESLPVAPDGFIPNSIVAALYRELRRKTNANEKFTDKWKPKELTDEQKAEIEKLNLKVFIFLLDFLFLK